MLFNEEVSITIGNKIIIKSSTIAIQKNEKYCILGSNGVGKTTLLNHIYDKIKLTSPDDILYITQSENIVDNCNIYEYMLKADNTLYENFMKFTELENKVNTDTSDETFEEYSKYLNLVNEQDFKKYSSQIYKILSGLGFDDYNKQINLLSGGEHTKLSLCKALLLEPSILLLDEPTNHLDLHNIIWLERYLMNYKKSLILVSHNIDFFDKIVDKTMFFFNIDPYNPQVFTCRGGYVNFLKMFNQMKTEYIKNYEKHCKKIVELKKNKDKTKVDDYLKNNVVNRPMRDYDIEIKFNQVATLSSNEYNNILSFSQVNFSYDSKHILEDIDIGISMKSRYILVGKNGSGKSTFFKLCLQQLMPTSGEIMRDTRIRIGYFNQNSITDLPDDLTPIEYLITINPKLTQEECRKILAKIGFKKMFEGDLFDIGKLKISDLSGGQKVRIVLCGIQITNPHIILFDEPTNHLDIYSINEYINCINEYNGGVVIITHDKYIIENINNYELLILQNKHMLKYNGSFDNYCDAIIS
jgi:ATPase subunit of ABC transporter with duplicated ATPase domains